ncbi:MAG: serine/threonine protein kinase, partial [Limisphaerales bacterium]
ITLGLSLNLALGHLHRNGLLHRDVKPSNIIFVNGVAKLADIGLVTDLAEAQSFVGTVGYIPPEGPNSSRADIYAMGKVLYEASMGKDRNEFPEPFTGLGLDARSKALMELNVVLLKACATEPRERYQSAEEMNVDLALLHSGESVRRRHMLERRLKLMTRIGVATVGVMLLGVVPYFLAIREAYQARAAQAVAREHLRVSYLAQAQSGRWSHRAGRRFTGLELVKKAAQIRPSLELRNEAIACLALPDLRIKRQWKPKQAGVTSVGYDEALERYAACDGQGNIEITRVEDGRVEFTLPGFGSAVALLQFSPHGKFLAVYYIGTRREMVVWDLLLKKALLQEAIPKLRRFAFAPNEAAFA